MKRSMSTVMTDYHKYKKNMNIFVSLYFCYTKPIKQSFHKDKICLHFSHYCSKFQSVIFTDKTCLKWCKPSLIVVYNVKSENLNLVNK